MLSFSSQNVDQVGELRGLQASPVSPQQKPSAKYLDMPMSPASTMCPMSPSSVMMSPMTSGGLSSTRFEMMDTFFRLTSDGEDDGEEYDEFEFHRSVSQVKDLQPETIGNNVATPPCKRKLDFEEYDLGSNKRVVNSESGMKWIVSGPPPGLSNLERQLQEVKDLYEETTGDDVDFEEYDLGHNKRVVNSECGMKWIVSGPAPTVSALERQLQEVKDLYEEATGDDVDFEEYDLGHNKRVVNSESGMKWIVSGPAPTMSALERQLQEVKDSYEEATGDDVDFEEYDLGHNKRVVNSESGMKWIVSGPAPTMSALERQLQEVKDVYEEDTGDNVDFEEYDLGHNKRVVNSESGMKWIVSGPAPTMSALERQLQEVKDLYEEATGDNVDFEEYDLGHNKRVVNSESGMKWIVSGPAPTMSALDRQLQEVKDLYEEATGDDVDFEEYDLGHNKRVVDSESGMKWIVSGPAPTMLALERQLQEVKDKYEEATGENLDFEEYDLGHSKRVVNSESGMKWIVSGPAPMMSALERKLQEVKDLYEEATGDNVDFEEYDLGHNKRVVKSGSGMKWIVSGPAPTISSLEKQLQEVKALYKQATCDVFNESD